ncbi:unnamed protein product [Allacma fusca]|uniref:Sushi domain-containing protein n=1 Tax=Allacma fusca TaxID=39272 RepID=A0A8J2JB80_9HEXA|nr:unnamed protein product [Allacma fusca]
MEPGLKMPQNFWWLLVITILVGINIEPSSSSCYHPPTPVKNGEVDVINYSKHVNHFPNGTMAKVTCKPGYTLHSPELKTRYCVNNDWTNSPPDEVVCVVPVKGRRQFEGISLKCGREH